MVIKQLHCILKQLDWATVGYVRNLWYRHVHTVEKLVPKRNLNFCELNHEYSSFEIEKYICETITIFYTHVSNNFGYTDILDIHKRHYRVRRITKDVINNYLK